MGRIIKWRYCQSRTKVAIEDDEDFQANKPGWTPPWIVCQRGHIEIVKLLFKDQRVDVNKSGDYCK